MSGFGKLATSIARVLPPLKLLPGVGLLTVLLVVPLALLLVMSFWRASFSGVEPDWTLANYVRLFSRPIYIELMIKSTRIAFTATALTIVVAFPLAYWISGKPPRRRAQLVFLVLIPFWTSYVVRTFAWIPLLGNNGVINYALIWLGITTQPLDIFLFNQFTVQLGLLYVYLPYAILPILLSLERLDRNLLYAAADLGASPFWQLWRIVIPLSMPGILGGAILVFILSISAYVTPALLGGASGIMIANVIPDLFGVGMNWPLGATVSLLLIVVTIAWIWLVGARVGLRRIFIEG
jgi:spermidine/putrescine transport system permease protein